MQVVYVFAVAAALVVLLSVPETGATKHLMLAPFLWAGHIAKDAAHHLAAFKLSIATKVLAMITGNRSFRATLEYDSRIERYRPSVGSSGGYQNKVPDFHPHPARPSPVHMEKNVKVDWFPGVKFPHFSLPSLPKISLPKFSHFNPFSHFSKLQLPSMPHLFALPHLHKLHKSLPHPSSVSGLFAAPKFASGYVNGAFNLGSGNPVQVNSGAIVPVGALPAVVVCCPAPVGGVAQSPALQSSGQLAVTAVSQTLPKPNGTTVAVVRTPEVQEANSTVAVTSPWVSVTGGSQILPGSNGTAAPIGTSPDGSYKRKVANTTVDVTIPPRTNQNRIRRSVNSTLAGYLSIVQANDEGHCIAKMVCAMAAEPEEFGAYGKKAVSFFEEMGASPIPSALVYIDAMAAGKSGKDCTAAYPYCKIDPKFLAHIGSTEL